MKKTLFYIPKMDCPSEEQIIRLKLADHYEIKQLDFQIQDRMLMVYHEGDYQNILSSLETLNFGAIIKESVSVDSTNVLSYNKNDQRNLLWKVLVINAFFFVLELIYGWISGSIGLMADALDMLADSLVYILALLAVGRSVKRQKQTAIWAGIFQFLLAILGLFEWISRFFNAELETEGLTMIWISFLALLGNLSCLLLLQKSQSKQAHMQASILFTSNDIIINLGVILAGFLVWFTGSNYPDLIVGGLVFLLVTKGSLDIIRLGRS